MFQILRVLHEGENDTMAHWVDRHSGWIVGVARRDKGLTGAKWVRKF